MEQQQQPIKLQKPVCILVGFLTPFLSCFLLLYSLTPRAESCDSGIFTARHTWTQLGAQGGVVQDRRRENPHRWH